MSGKGIDEFSTNSLILSESQSNGKRREDVWTGKCVIEHAGEQSEQYLSISDDEAKSAATAFV